jgi:hypothetical protein
MKYYKTPDGYISIDEKTQVNANGSRIPTNILAYGRGPTRPNDAGSVASRLFNTREVVRDGLEVPAQDVPTQWREALGLVKVEPVCQSPAGRNAPEKAYSPGTNALEQVAYFIAGLIVGILIALALPGLFK